MNHGGLKTQRLGKDSEALYCLARRDQMSGRWAETSSGW